MFKCPYENCQALQERAWRIEGEILNGKALSRNIPQNINASKTSEKHKSLLLALLKDFHDKLISQ